MSQEKQWDLTETSKEKKIQELLANGWEPFAVLEGTEGKDEDYWPRVFFRKYIEKPHFVCSDII